MIQFNIQTSKNNFYSFEGFIKYVGKKNGVYGDWTIHTSSYTNLADFEKELKRQIKLNKATYEVIVNKLIWKSDIDYKINQKIYQDPITGFLVFPSADNTPKANEVYTYEIKNNKAKLI